MLHYGNRKVTKIVFLVVSFYKDRYESVLVKIDKSKAKAHCNTAVT